MKCEFSLAQWAIYAKCLFGFCFACAMSGPKTLRFRRKLFLFNVPFHRLPQANFHAVLGMVEKYGRNLVQSLWS